MEIAINEKRIKPVHEFTTTYPWSAIKDAVGAALTKFGNYCSIVIGILDIIGIVKNCYVYLIGCMVKDVATGYRNCPYTTRAVLTEEDTRNSCQHKMIKTNLCKMQMLLATKQTE